MNGEFRAVSTRSAKQPCAQASPREIPTTSRRNIDEWRILKLTQAEEDRYSQDHALPRAPPPYGASCGFATTAGSRWFPATVRSGDKFVFLPSVTCFLIFKTRCSLFSYGGQCNFFRPSKGLNLGITAEHAVANTWNEPRLWSCHVQSRAPSNERRQKRGTHTPFAVKVAASISLALRN